MGVSYLISLFCSHISYVPSSIKILKIRLDPDSLPIMVLFVMAKESRGCPEVLFDSLTSRTVYHVKPFCAVSFSLVYIKTVKKLFCMYIQFLRVEIVSFISLIVVNHVIRRLCITFVIPWQQIFQSNYFAFQMHSNN